MGDCILPLPSVRFLCVAWPLKKHFAIAHRKELEFATLRPPSRKTPYPQGIVVIQGRRSIPPPRHWTGAPLFLRARSVILRPHTCNLSHRRAHRSRLCRVQNGLLGLAPLLHCRNKLRPISAPTRHRSEETRGFFTLTNSRIHRLVCMTRIWPTACPLSLINFGEWNWKAEGFLPSVRVQG